MQITQCKDTLEMDNGHTDSSMSDGPQRTVVTESSRAPIQTRDTASIISQLRRSTSDVADSHDHHVSRATVNFWLDVTLMLLFVALAIVATLVQFVFPPGTGAKGWTLWTLDFNQWSSLQYGLLAAFGVACVVHVMLHWSWVCTIVSRRFLRQETPDDGIQTILGVALLIGLLLTGAVVVGTAKMMIQMPPQ